MFLWLCISAFFVLLEVLIKDALLILNLDPVFILWSLLLVHVCTFAGASYYSFIYVRTSKVRLVKVFQWLVILFVCLQVLQFMSPFMLDAFKFDNFFENRSLYHEFILEHHQQWIITMLLSYLIYIFPVYFIFKLNKEIEVI